MTRGILSNFDKLKAFCNDFVRVHEIGGPGSYMYPNSISNFNLRIRYGNFGLKVNRLSPFSTFGSIIIDPKAKMLIAAPLKCGSKTVRDFAQRQLSMVHESKVKEFPHASFLPILANREHPISGSYIHNNTIFWNEFEEYDLFIVMRDPFERLVSYFLEKFVVFQRPYVHTSRFAYSEVLTGLSHLMPFKDFDIYDLTFEQFIFKLYRRFHRSEKIWDAHLAPQVTADFNKIAQDKAQIIRLDELNRFLKEWGNAHNLDLIINEQGPVHSIHIHEAYKIPLTKLIQEPSTIRSSSFIHERLMQRVERMYATDFNWWNQAS